MDRTEPATDQPDAGAAGPGGRFAAPISEREQIAVSKIFASSPDETRSIRAADRAMFAVSLVVLGMAAWASDERTATENWLDSVVHGAPNWVTTIAGAVYVAGGLWALGLVLYLAVRRYRFALMRDMLVAALTAVVLGLLVARVLLGEWPEVVPEIGTLDEPKFPALRLAIVTSILTVGRPSLTVPVRTVNRRLVFAMAASSLVVGYGDLTSIIGALALGFGAAALTRSVFGTSIGIPTLHRVRASLIDLNVPVDDLAYAPLQPSDRLLATASDGRGSLDLTIFSRDSAGSARAARIWRAMWYREARSVLGVSREQQVEHAALMLLLAKRADIVVPEVVAVGATSTDDALLVTRDDRRPTLASIDTDEVDDDLVGRLWVELGRLHANNLSHGRVEASQLTIDPDDPGGRPGFRDLSYGAMAPDALERHIDIVELLVTTALITDVDRAIDVMTRNVPRETIEKALSVIQRAALGRDIGAAVKAAKFDVDDLRERVAARLEIEAPQVAQLRRVRVRDIVMLALLLVVANAILSWVLTIDFATLSDEIADASIGWLVIALILSQLTNVAETVSMGGVVSQPLPFGPTMHFQYATSYIGLAVPSDAGRIAMTIRYLQKLGVPTRVAVGQGPFTTVFGYLIDAIFLLVSAKVVGTDIDLPDDTDLSGVVTLAIILGVLVVVGIAAVLLIPKLRRRIVPAVTETVQELKGSLTDPKRASLLIGGLVVKKLLFALTLLCVVTAYGYPLSFATILFINTAVSWFAGMVPVPGGIGVAEAGFVIGLTAFGVPESAALATAITHRMLTSYLPPVVGYFSMRKLEREGFL